MSFTNNKSEEDASGESVYITYTSAQFRAERFFEVADRRTALAVIRSGRSPDGKWPVNYHGSILNAAAMRKRGRSLKAGKLEFDSSGHLSRYRSDEYYERLSPDEIGWVTEEEYQAFAAIHRTAYPNDPVLPDSIEWFKAHARTGYVPSVVSDRAAD